MKQENTRRLIRNVAVVGGIIVIVVIIFLIVRAVFSQGATPSQTQATNPLLDTSTDRGVMMSVRGPLVSSENARTYQIDVTPTSRSVTLFSGYDGTVISKQVYSNSMSAYEQFAYALDEAGMTTSRNSSITDTRGVCATGRVYTFTLERDTTAESSLWTSSCSSSKGTLGGSSSSLRMLFDAQIPDISKYRGGLY